MRHLSKALTVATLTLACVAFTVPAQADDRYASRTTVTDPSGDAVRTGAATPAQAAAYDIKSLTARQRMAPDGSLHAQAVVTVKNAGFGVESTTVSAKFTFETPKKFTAVASFTNNGGLEVSRFYVNGKAQACSTMNLAHNGDNTAFVVSVPYTCLPSGGKFRATAQVSTTKNGGDGKVTDSTSATPASALSYIPFRTGRMTEAAGDVDYGSRPGDERGAGRSVDLLASSATYTPFTKMLRATAQVLDLSTRRYDPIQQFGVGLFDGSGASAGSLTVVPDRSGAGKHVFKTTGFTCAGLKVSGFDATSDTISIDIPRTCLSNLNAVHLLTLGAAYDADANLLGLDATPQSPLISLR